MEAIPAGGVIDIANTNSAFAALKKDGSAQCWGEPRCGGKVQGSLPPMRSRSMQRKEHLPPCIEVALSRHGATPSLEGMWL